MNDQIGLTDQFVTPNNPWRAVSPLEKPWEGIEDRFWELMGIKALPLPASCNLPPEIIAQNGEVKQRDNITRHYWRYKHVIKRTQELVREECLDDPQCAPNQSTLNKIFQVFIDMRPIQGNFRYYPLGENWLSENGPVEHIVATAVIAFKLAKALNQKQTETVVDPYRIAAAMLIHDWGRLVTHAFGITDLMTKAILMSANVPKELFGLAHTAELYTGNVIFPLEKLTWATMVSIVSDTAGKPSKETQLPHLRLIEEIPEAVKRGKQAYTAMGIPQKAMEEYTRREQITLPYVFERFRQYGIDLNVIIRSIGLESIREAVRRGNIEDLFV